MTGSSRSIRVRPCRLRLFFWGARGCKAGRRKSCWRSPPGTTVQDAAARRGQRHPPLAPLLGSVRWALNFEFAPLNTPLNAGDELALLPPVQGGAPRTLVTEAPLLPDTILGWVQHPTAGATTSFVGTVRNHSRGQEVVRLEYEAYVPMVQRQLELICDHCEGVAEGTRLAIGHRYGTLYIGDISVVIAASSPHREAAFDACRQAIERIKTDVPIWKQEFTTDGASWVGWGGG